MKYFRKDFAKDLAEFTNKFSLFSLSFALNKCSRGHSSTKFCYFENFETPFPPPPPPLPSPFHSPTPVYEWSLQDFIKYFNSLYSNLIYDMLMRFASLKCKKLFKLKIQNSPHYYFPISIISPGENQGNHVEIMKKYISP